MMKNPDKYLPSFLYMKKIPETLIQIFHPYFKDRFEFLSLQTIIRMLFHGISQLFNITRVRNFQENHFRHVEKVITILQAIWFSLQFDVFGTTHFVLAHFTDIISTSTLQPCLNMNEATESLNRFVKNFLEHSKTRAKSQNSTSLESVALEDLILHKVASILKDSSENNLKLNFPENEFKVNEELLETFYFLFI